jgi:hypothetical protein
LISPDNKKKKLYTFDEFVDTYNVNINFVEYYGIISAIPNNWKQLIPDENIKLDRICNEIVDKIKPENKPCKYFYKLFIRRVQQEPIYCHKKWEYDLETSIEDWHDIYSLSFCKLKKQNYKAFSLNYCIEFYLLIHSYEKNVDLKKQNYVLFVWKLRKTCYIYFGIAIELKQFGLLLKTFNDLWYGSAINSKGDNSWNI